MFHKLKPFYISPPTENEKESCLCIKCQNSHGLYEPLKKHDDLLPDSLTEFLTSTIQCEKDNKLSFAHIDCIHSKCENACKLATHTERSFADKTVKKYYIAEKVPTEYFDQHGKKKVL